MCDDMTIQLKASGKKRFHPEAIQFVFEALRYTQNKLQREMLDEEDLENEDSHISGEELLNGIRELGLKQFGRMAYTVFEQWNVTCTGDFGQIVFQMIEEGKMRKTDRDQLSDFIDVYDFEQALEREYIVDVNKAFVTRENKSGDMLA